jgi:uncharacterized repeat protein (TIGR03847 family)
MSASFDFESPDHFTTGTVGPPGQRVFYLQAREAGALVTLKVEKEHVRSLADALAMLLAKLPTPDDVPADPVLLEPIEAQWVVGSMAVGYDEAQDRIVILAKELVEEEEAESASARLRITRGQAAAFVERGQALMKAGRPICPMCSQPQDPGGHLCPRRNGPVPTRV